jgi:predicted SnoaL-like aldol condensation-catalyzing enzyme
MNTIENKEKAQNFLKLVIAGEIDKAYDKFVDVNGKHHNPYFAAGFPVLKKGMKDNHEQFPDKKLNIKHIIEDGDLVVVHLHLFRFDSGKILEMWDIGQPIQADSPNKDGAF